MVRAARRLLESGRPLVATVARRGGGLIREAKEHPASELWEITPENRDEMPARVEAWLRERVEPMIDTPPS